MGDVRIVHDGTSISRLNAGADDMHYRATMTGTAIIPIEVGQKVIHTVLFHQICFMGR